MREGGPKGGGGLRKREGRRGWATRERELCLCVVNVLGKFAVAKYNTASVASISG